MSKIKVDGQVYDLNTQSTSRSATPDQIKKPTIIQKMRASNLKGKGTFLSLDPRNPKPKQINNIIININNNVQIPASTPKNDIRLQINNDNNKVEVDVKDEVLGMNQKRSFVYLSRLISSSKCKWFYISALLYSTLLLACSISAIFINISLYLYILNPIALIFILLDFIVRVKLYVI
jgi:hypothetical protein